MFDKKSVLAGSSPAASDQVHTIIGPESVFTGKLTFEGTVRIDGKFNGEIASQGKLIIGDAAVVEGQVDVNTLISSGSITGDVLARTRVELKSPGKVNGTLTTPILVIDEGVRFDGQCRMDGADKAKFSPARKPGDDSAPKKDPDSKK